MNTKVFEQAQVIANAAVETNYLSLVEEVALAPGAAATQAFVRWSEENPWWNQSLAARVDFHAEGADWVYQYSSVGRSAVAATVCSGEAA